MMSIKSANTNTFGPAKWDDIRKEFANGASEAVGASVIISSFAVAGTCIGVAASGSNIPGITGALAATVVAAGAVGVAGVSSVIALSPIFASDSIVAHEYKHPTAKKLGMVFGFVAPIITGLAIGAATYQYNKAPTLDLKVSASANCNHTDMQRDNAAEFIITCPK